MQLRRYQIQEVYLTMQQSLGVLIENAPSEADQTKLRNVSTELVRIKRSMIGDFDEIATEKLPL